MNKLIAAVAGLMLAFPITAQDPVAADAKAPVQQKPAYVTMHAYPLTTCVVSGHALEADAVSVEAGGRTFKLCCADCKPKLEQNLEANIKKLDEAIVKAQLPGYPLEVCAVAGKKLGSMGDPIQLVLDGTLVQLCCKGCTKKAMAAPAEMAKKVRDAAFEKQMANPPATCPVSGEAVGDKAVNIMIDNTLVRTCCKKCAEKVQKDPSKYVGKADAKPKDAKDAKPADGEKKKDAGR